jgi:hypothetical protein
MSDTSTSDCEHGQLARSCNICELQVQVVTLQQTIATLHAVLSRPALDEAVDEATPHVHDVSPAAFGIGEVKRAGAEALRNVLQQKVQGLGLPASPDVVTPLIYANLWPAATSHVVKSLEAIASTVDLPSQDRFYSLVQAFARGKNRAIRTALLAPHKD